MSTPLPPMDPYTAAFLLILLTMALTIAFPWVHEHYIYPVLERRRLAAEYAAGTRTDPTVLEESRRKAAEAAANEYTVKSLLEQERKAAKAAAAAEDALKRLRGGLTSYYATDNLQDIANVRDVAALKARQAAAVEKYDAAQRVYTDEELARRREASEAQQALWNEEEARREAAREGRPFSVSPAAGEAGAAPVSTASTSSVHSDKAQRELSSSTLPHLSGSDGRTSSSSTPGGATRKRILVDEELAVARKETAGLRLVPEPSADDAGALVTLVIECADAGRGAFRITRRFRGSDTLQNVMDVIQVNIPGGMSGRQVETRHPRSVVVSWKDYDLRDYKFDTEFEKLRVRLATAAPSSGTAVAAAAGDKRQLVTLEEACLKGRCALFLRPLDL